MRDKPWTSWNLNSNRAGIFPGVFALDVLLGVFSDRGDTMCASQVLFLTRMLLWCDPNRDADSQLEMHNLAYTFVMLK